MTHIERKSVFLCHSSQDKPFVREVGRMIEKYGAEVWIDEAEIGIGESIITKISEAIQRIDFVVAFISTDSIRSQWVRKELGMSMAEEISSGFNKVLPVVIDECDVPFYLLDKRYCDLRNRDLKSGDFVDLIKAIGIKPEDGEGFPFSTVLLDLLGILWENQDGAMGAEIAMYFECGLINHPGLYIPWMLDNVQITEMYLDQIDYYSFTDFAGFGRARYENMREDMIVSLTSVSGVMNLTPDQKSFIDKYLSALDKVQIKEIY